MDIELLEDRFIANAAGGVLPPPPPPPQETTRNNIDKYKNLFTVKLYMNKKKEGRLPSFFEY